MSLNCLNSKLHLQSSPQPQAVTHHFPGRLAHSLLFSEALLGQVFLSCPLHLADVVLPGVPSKKNLFCVLQCTTSLHGRLYSKAHPQLLSSAPIKTSFSATCWCSEQQQLLTAAVWRKKSSSGSPLRSNNY